MTDLDPLAVLEETCMRRERTGRDRGLTHAWSRAWNLLWRVRIMRMFGGNQGGGEGEVAVMKTEEEARKCWCPFVRHYNAMHQPCGNSMAGTTANNERAGRWPTNCIASECMAWRWGNHPDRKFAAAGFSQGRMNITPIAGTLSADVADTEVTTEWTQTVPNTDPPRGFCGLAGKP